MHTAVACAYACNAVMVGIVVVEAIIVVITLLSAAGQFAETWFGLI